MSFTKTMFALAVGTVGVTAAMSAHAVNLNNGDILTINTGVIDLYNSNNTSGSYFVMDLNGNSIANNTELVSLSQGSVGITIGQPIAGGNFHAGPPLPADANSGAMVDSWLFNGSTGTNYVSNATGVTGGTVGGLDLSGLGVSWSGFSAIPMGSGSWSIKPAAQPGGGVQTLPSSGYSSGLAKFEWDGIYGNAYTLTYTATVPTGDSSGFGGTQYALHLEGTVQAAPVPEASTYGMMLAGLGLVGGMVARRRKMLA